MMSDTTIDCFVGGMSEYREGTRSACSGSYHRVVFKWEMRGGTIVQGEDSMETIVCEGHLQAFRELGEREEYKFHIESDTKIESPIAGEKET